MANKRIAFILGSMGQGGAEKVISVLSRDYAGLGWDTDIIVLLDNRVSYDLHPNTRIIDFSGNTPSRIKRLPIWVKKLNSYVKTNRPDILLSFTARINIITFFACRKDVKKLYVSERNDPRYDGRSKLVDIFTKILYPRTNGVIFQTEYVKSYFSKIKNSCVIPNPIYIETKASKKRENRIVSVGSLKNQKNHKLLIESFMEIKDEFPEYTLTIYGEGALRNDLEYQIEKNNLTGRVFLPGGKKNVHEYISDAKLFVLSSTYEGLSNALLEALAMGIACISTDCAGASEYIDGMNGMVVPIKDKIELSNAIRKMLNDDNYRKMCEKNAIITSFKFDYNQVLNKWHGFMD
ncbi:glycosyltransferase [Anaerorhabdus sp.]|uniref:glycosyltransferase n=1 Tax=Anaerorhabdus sp. TaxID=1872524 RepID=UPI002FC9D554